MYSEYSDSPAFWVGVIIGGVIMGFVALKVAEMKGREPGVGWFCLGFFFGLIGVLITALIPSPQNKNPYFDNRYNNGYGPGPNGYPQNFNNGYGPGPNGYPQNFNNGYGPGPNGYPQNFNNGYNQNPNDFAKNPYDAQQQNNFGQNIDDIPDIEPLMFNENKNKENDPYNTNF